MDLVLDERITQTTTTEQEARNHNAQIKERYRRLQSAEADQFASDISERTETRASVITPEAPVYTAPVTEQAPTVTEFVTPREASAVFTTEKFERIQDMEQPATYAPVEIAHTPVQSPAAVATTATEVGYSLSTFAKTVMAVFAMVVVAMLTLICINTHILNQKSVRLKNLEEKRDQLVEQNAELQERIEIAQSYETIRQYAESHGMVQAGN